MGGFMLDTIKYILGEFSRIADAPASFVVLVLAVFGLIWWAMDWHYGGIIANRDSTIISRDAELKLATAQRDDYRDKLSGASPDQAKLEIESLEQNISSLKHQIDEAHSVKNHS